MDLPADRRSAATRTGADPPSGQIRGSTCRLNKVLVVGRHAPLVKQRFADYVDGKAKGLDEAKVRIVIE